MKRVLALLILSSAIIAPPVMGKGVDYTNRNYTVASCALFASDVHVAASSYARGDRLTEILKLVEHAPLADSNKQRLFQAVQFVWKNRLDNPVLAQSIAMGLCLKPKQQMAPMDEPWVTSPRTSKEYF